MSSTAWLRSRATCWARRLAVVPAAAVLATVAVSPAQAAAPPRRDISAAIEPFAAHQPQFLCRTTVQPGVAAFRDLLVRTYAGTRSVSEVRRCDGSSSEHFDGRALDWGVNVANATQLAQGKALLNWLLATDKYGNKAAMARRLGIMYVIWNKQIWGSWNQSWAPYSCSGVTACHMDHMHFSFGWAGAYKKTSYWTGAVAPVMAPPIPVYDSLTTAMTVKVPMNVKKVWAPSSLRQGRTYSYTAAGVWMYGRSAWQQADAACLYRADGLGWRRSDVFQGSFTWSWKPTVDTGGGCNTKTHTYVATVKPPYSDAISFGTLDPTRADNAGALTVTVRRTA